MFCFEVCGPAGVPAWARIRQEACGLASSATNVGWWSQCPGCQPNPPPHPSLLLWRPLCLARCCGPLPHPAAGGSEAGFVPAVAVSCFRCCSPSRGTLRLCPSTVCFYYETLPVTFHTEKWETHHRGFSAQTPESGLAS